MHKKSHSDKKKKSVKKSVKKVKALPEISPENPEDVQHEAVQHEAVQHEAVQHEAVQHEDVQHEESCDVTMLLSESEQMNNIINSCKSDEQEAPVPVAKMDNCCSTIVINVNKDERIRVGDAVGIAPKSGLIVKGYAAYLDYDLLSQISEPITEEIQGVVGIHPGMTSGHDVAVINDELSAWLLTDKSKETVGKTYLILGVLTAGAAVRITGSPYTINHGEPITGPVIWSMNRRIDNKDIHYLLVWFECINETKNKVEVLRVEHDKNGVPLVTTVFGPAKAAGASATDCRIALIDEKKAAFIRRRNRTVEIVPADISKLPVIIMGNPVSILEDRVVDQSGSYSASGVIGIRTVEHDPSLSDTPRSQYEWPNLVVVAPTIVSNSGCHRLTLIEGRVSLPGPIYYRGQESTVAVLPEDISPVSSVENLTPNVVAIIHNSASGLGVSCMTVNPLKMMSHTISRPVFIYPKQASVIRSACLRSEHQIVVSHLNGSGSDKKTGLVHVLDGANIASQLPRVLVSSTVWSHTQSSPDFSLSTSTLGNTFYISSDKGLQKGTIIDNAIVSFTDGMMPIEPIGVVKKVNDDGSSVVVTRAGLHKSDAGSFVPGARYYAHADGSVIPSKHSKNHSLYPEAVPIGIAISDSELWVEVGQTKW